MHCQTLLREKDVNPLHPWDTSLPLFINDPRYVLLPSVSARKEAFDEYCRDRARELRQSNVKKEKETISPKEEFETAVGYLKGGQYEAAEKGFSSFLQKNPKNRLVAEAVFDLGESYFQRGRHREAAEQYLKISTTYSTSARAPDAMLRLGQSLGALGAKEQACASFNEIARKYPSASPTVRASADREAKKNAC